MFVGCASSGNQWAAGESGAGRAHRWADSGCCGLAPRLGEDGFPSCWPGLRRVWGECQSWVRLIIRQVSQWFERPRDGHVQLVPPELPERLLPRTDSCFDLGGRLTSLEFLDAGDQPVGAGLLEFVFVLCLDLTRCIADRIELEIDVRPPVIDKDRGSAYVDADSVMPQFVVDGPRGDPPAVVRDEVNGRESGTLQVQGPDVAIADHSAGFTSVQASDRRVQPVAMIIVAENVGSPQAASLGSLHLLHHDRFHVGNLVSALDC